MEKDIIELDIPNDQLLELALLAHEKDITLNQLMVEIITSKLEDTENEIN